MGAAGWLHTWGGQRTSQHLPSHQCPAWRYHCHPGAHARSGQPATPLDQLLSASLAFIEAAESFLKKKGRDFLESQGKTCADLPQPQKERPSADRGTNRPKQCMWPRHPLMQGLVQPRDEICPLEYQKNAKCYVGHLYPGGICSLSLLTFWDPRVFLYKWETLLRSKVLLSSYKHLKKYYFLFVVPVCKGSCYLGAALTCWSAQHLESVSAQEPGST